MARPRLERAGTTINTPCQGRDVAPIDGYPGARPLRQPARALRRLRWRGPESQDGGKARRPGSAPAQRGLVPVSPTGATPPARSSPSPVAQTGRPALHCIQGAAQPTRQPMPEPDFLFSVPCELISNCRRTILVLPDDMPSHPTRNSIDVVSLAPNAEITVFPWREPREFKARTIGRVRTFLKIAHSDAQRSSGASDENYIRPSGNSPPVRHWAVRLSQRELAKSAGSCLDPHEEDLALAASRFRGAPTCSGRT